MADASVQHCDNKSEVEHEIPLKKRKLEENEDQCLHSDIKDLSGFEITNILHNNTNRKTISLRGSFKSKKGEAVVILEKTAFSTDTLTNDTGSLKGELEKIFHNDIYGNYKFLPTTELKSIKATIIHPATDKHIIKYSSQNCYMVDESPEIYKSAVLKYIEQEQFDLQWVYNILEHKSEAERILVEDKDPVNGFVIVPDLKWNGEIDTLYFLAICNRRDIKSLRDLSAKHIPLLENIKEKGLSAIQCKYGLDSSQLRIYFHYQPSFYHLHIHITHLKHEAPGILAERAHMLMTVINNLNLMPDYYEKATIPYVVRENDKLFETLEEKGFLKKCLKSQ
ncbi:m7GpppX diphosphatase-like isoform X2 [Rhynchophorus ferrugineus]|uniref:m7GpppX diphosphatase-like isoform X2 n=1 Tax=Rhynchophorus ferrugineus TaxID=354439 RepID=UPI003FCE1A03